LVVIVRQIPDGRIARISKLYEIESRYRYPGSG